MGEYLAKFIEWFSADFLVERLVNVLTQNRENEMQILFAGMKRREPYLPGMEDHDDYKYWLPTRRIGASTWVVGRSSYRILAWSVLLWPTRSFQCQRFLRHCLSVLRQLAIFSRLL